MIFGEMVSVFIGLILTFASMCLFVSTLTEALSSLVKLRSLTLVGGLKSLLNDQALGDLAKDVLNHGAVSSRSPSNKASQCWYYFKRPSYIEPKQFASALVDVLQDPVKFKGAPVTLQGAIDKVGDPQLKTLFQGIYDRVNGKLQDFHQEIAEWFDASMDRISGVYKRNMQIITFIIALALAGWMNVDAIYLAKYLWANPEIVTKAPILAPGEQAPAALDKLEKAGFPIGWEAPGDKNTKIAMEKVTVDGWKWLGWFLTAIATLFGAPFWFDMLQRFVQLRGTGPAPAAKPGG
jgi:hypothetical protein